MAKRGRPPILTEMVQTAAGETKSRGQLFIDALRLGNTIATSAHYAGIDPSTVYRAMDRGQQAHGPKWAKDFYEKCKKSQAEVEAACVGYILTAARNGDWRAGAFLISRRNPEAWSEKQTVVATTTVKTDEAAPPVFRITIPDAPRSAEELDRIRQADLARMSAAAVG